MGNKYQLPVKSIPCLKLLKAGNQKMKRGLVPCIITLLFVYARCQTTEPDYSDLREKMVKEQIIARGIKDRKVIKAMMEVPRHLFVPEKYRKEAYGDYPLPIGFGQTISQPYVVAFMTEAVELKSNYKVLEIGTGSGYQAAVLAEIVDSVFTVEIIGELSKRARKVIGELGYKNVFLRVGNGWYGWKEHAPYDAIIVTAAADSIPSALVEQLKDGGKMIVPIGPQFSLQFLYLIEKRKGEINTKSLLPVRFVPLRRQ